MAKHGHRAQVRKELGPDGEPLRYFEHVQKVALVLIDEVAITLPNMIITALLHDVIEDIRNLTPEMIEHVWGADAVSMVKVLRKDPPEGYLYRFKRCAD